jgi:hypothetical protein
MNERPSSTETSPENPEAISEAAFGVAGFKLNDTVRVLVWTGQSKGYQLQDGWSIKAFGARPRFGRTEVTAVLTSPDGNSEKMIGLHALLKNNQIGSQPDNVDPE